MATGDRASEYRSALIVVGLTATVCQSQPLNWRKFAPFILYPIKRFRIHDLQSRLNESSYSCQRGDEKLRRRAHFVQKNSNLLLRHGSLLIMCSAAT